VIVWLGAAIVTINAKLLGGAVYVLSELYVTISAQDIDPFSK
jgi:hypothetical protein